MGRYPGDDEEKAERQRQRGREREKDREAAEQQAWAEANAQRRRERAERLARVRAAWDEAGGAEQTRMLLVGLSQLLGWAVRRTWRWAFVKRGGFLRNRDGEVRGWLLFGAAAIAIVWFLLWAAMLDVRKTRAEIARDAPKCRAVYEQIARAPDEIAYQKARALLAPLTCTHASVPGPERIEELMGND